MKLFTYFRSSAAYRVRIALNLKGLPVDAVPVHLTQSGGEQNQADYRSRNPSGLVPLLIDDGLVLPQSMAIIEYLDERHPEPRLMPSDPAGRARVRAFAQGIACDLHPLNNLRVLKYLEDVLHVAEAERKAWYRHWVHQGLAVLEATLGANAHHERYCYGDSPTLADCCLVPQLYNARRFDCPVERFPTLLRIDAACAELDAFRRAAPERQPDAGSPVAPASRGA